MIHARTKEYLSLLLSIQYTRYRDREYDYSTQPRPCHNLAFMLEGEALVESNEEIIRLKAGDILFIPQNTTYKVKWFANPKTVFHSLHFSFLDQNDVLANRNIPVQMLNNAHFKDLYALLKEIEKYQFSKTTDSFLALSAFYKICGLLFKEIEINETSASQKALQPAFAYIQQNYAKHITVQYLANLCFLSPSRFYYLFKEQTGISPIVYKNKITIQNAAKELLYNKNMSIKEIAQKHGFVSTIYFERLFKKAMGKTPSQYRNEDSWI